jgi:hypothetical protein
VAKAMIESLINYCMYRMYMRLSQIWRAVFVAGMPGEVIARELPLRVRVANASVKRRDCVRVALFCSELPHTDQR